MDHEETLCEYDALTVARDELRVPVESCLETTKRRLALRVIELMRDERKPLEPGTWVRLTATGEIGVIKHGPLSTPKYYLHILDALAISGKVRAGYYDRETFSVYEPTVEDFKAVFAH